MRSFPKWDVYYLYEYAYSFMLHGDGDIYLIYFENGKDRLCYVVMENDISKAKQFQNRLESGRYYDWETPYGYGGPLVDAVISEKSREVFKSEIKDYCMKRGIVAQFIRFHPLLKNHDILPNLIEAQYLRDTIFVDTTSRELIISNMDSKNRNMVRKAQKNGVTIIVKDIQEFEAFLSMYNETMKEKGAEDYYAFKRDYFESLSALKDNALIFYAMYEGMPISGSIMYYNDWNMHYHLSGSFAEYRKYSPGNLLLYEAACWANDHGIKRFHLGGGMLPNDSLFGFKKQFNKNGRIAFTVGRTVFDQEAYEELLKVRKKIDPDFDIKNKFMIQYRR
ncbi:MAG: GNAT family N-acetyltransferase [Lachnospiraceae bacterium]|nr:GNAT family N-acetyltransferase [Lachnospiraceae bacterium]